MKAVNRLAIAIALVNAGVALPAFSQENTPETVEEEVVVTGFRRSLIQAMDIKRDSNGVVDAISAEDIGKFPDSNLAESLQRITGVSIDRNNGEGSEITVRGFGPSFNLVTLNGRTMPFAASPKQEGAGGTQKRSFKFDQIASESVAGVNIYKTAKADQASGGIGASVDVRTQKPLDLDDFTTSFTLKGVMDSTVEEGDDITPEISGMFSSTFADGKFGALIAFSHARRDSREEIIATDGWLRTGEDCEVGWIRSTNHTGCSGPGGTVDDSAIDLSRNPNAYLWMPQNYNMDVSDHERQRDNLQVVLQAAPQENLEFTLDFFASDFNDTIRRRQTAHWMGPFHGGVSAITDANGTIANYSNGFASVDFINYFDDILTENRSVGFNVDWQVNDSLNLNFDYHHSTAHAQPNGDFSEKSVLLASTDFTCQFPATGCYGASSFNVNYGSDDLPSMEDFGNITAAWVDVGDGNGPYEPNATHDGADPYDTSLVTGNLIIARGNEVENDVDQFKLDGVWDNSDDADLKRIKFGLSHIDMQFDTIWRFSQTGIGGIPTQTLIGMEADPTFIPRGDVASDFSGHESLFRGFMDFSAESIFDAYESAGLLNINPTETNLLNETTTALYTQFEIESEFQGIPISIVAGVRYEETDVEGTTRSVTPYGLRYMSLTELRPQFREGDDAFGTITLEGNYSYWLPNLDVSASFTDDLVGRFSVGRSLTRNDLTSLRPAPVIANSRPGGPFLAFQGNPDLLPYISDNLDLSLEWYFDEGSYASIGYFKKLVDNYASTTTTKGPFLNDEGIAITDPSANIAAACPANGQDIPECDSLYDGSQPEIEWQITTPTNSDSAEVDGFEIAYQQIFGETGFGVQANATFVNGDIEYDVYSTENQVALTGLSDSANLVGFYEKYGLQARIAYNWRDDFLLGTDQLRAPDEPVFTEEYGQIDISVSYDVNDQFTVFLEGLNVADEDLRQHGRFENQLVSAQNFGPRYNIGVRANF